MCDEMDFLLNFYLKALKQNCEHSAKNCEQSLQKLRTNRIMNKRAFPMNFKIAFRERKTHDSQRCDKILRLFRRAEIGQFSAHCGASSLLNYTDNLEKSWAALYGRD